MIDDLEAMLTPPDAGSPAKRAELLVASTRILRRRYQVRRIGSLAAVVAVFIVGGAAGWLLKPDRIVREIEYVAAPPVPPAPPTPAPPQESPKAEQVVLTPGALEVKAELSDDKAEVARLYREAGDKYLSEIRDYAQAARCYRLHLNAADNEQQKVSTKDSWLLISMKSSLHKENSDANSGS